MLKKTKTKIINELKEQFKSSVKNDLYDTVKVIQYNGVYIPDATTLFWYIATHQGTGSTPYFNEILGSIYDNQSASNALNEKADKENTYTKLETDAVVNDEKNAREQADEILHDELEDKLDKTSTITAVWSGTQAEYDAISTKSATTIYFIKE